METNGSGRTTKSGVSEGNVEIGLEKLSLDSEEDEEELICSVCYDVLLQGRLTETEWKIFHCSNRVSKWKLSSKLF